MPLISEVGKRKLKVRLTLTLITIFLWIGVIIHLFPVWWMFTTSIKPYTEVYQFPPTLWPRNPTFASYKLIFWLFKGGRGRLGFLCPIWVYIKNSFIISGGTVIMQVPITALVAYALSKLTSPRSSRILFLYFIGTMMIPISISLIPNYLIIRHFPFPTNRVPKIPFTSTPFPSINFLDTFWAVIIPSAYSAFSVLLFKGFFDTIPDEIINAARLDGASELTIFRRVVLPLSRPTFAVVIYFAFTGAWNSFLWPITVLRDETKFPINVLMYKVERVVSTLSRETALTDENWREILQAGFGMNGVMMLAIIESIPVFIMFIILREELMKGIKLRGFK